MSSTASNSLAQASSSYLRSAMHQPIRWHEWGEAAFAERKRENKPILLDIGAVWCHWCHVMDRESYDDPKIADSLTRISFPSRWIAMSDPTSTRVTSRRSRRSADRVAGRLPAS